MLGRAALFLSDNFSEYSQVGGVVQLVIVYFTCNIYFISLRFSNLPSPMHTLATNFTLWSVNWEMTSHHRGLSINQLKFFQDLGNKYSPSFRIFLGFAIISFNYCFESRENFCINVFQLYFWNFYNFREMNLGESLCNPYSNLCILFIKPLNCNKKQISFLLFNPDRHEQRNTITKNSEMHKKN